ncbi:hypothetical protein, partial [Salmonella enterica]|uniref:hypothetical protein n=1 Tax=Salmonella enterica TaxID=28901 RepID=UPI0022B6C003|nr:hypothetical protein [Salmonella enterica]
ERAHGGLLHAADGRGRGQAQPERDLLRDALRPQPWRERLVQLFGPPERAHSVRDYLAGRGAEPARTEPSQPSLAG